MPAPRVVLHIGLHKTATRFLQRGVFSGLDPERFLFNPPELMSGIKRALRFPAEDIRADARDAAATALAVAGARTLVISEPTISGDMYSSHEDWRRNLDLVQELFPGATILYFVRRQSDWLQSAYRQSLAKGRGVSIESFLNFRNGAFEARPDRFMGGARTVNALDLRFLEIYRGYASVFGAERVYLFRQEDLRHRQDDVYRRVAEAIGADSIPVSSKRVSGNRAFSALAIHLFFPGVFSRPQEPGRKHYRNALTERLSRTLRRLRTAFIQHVFDRILYIDWDLLERNGMRDELEAHYDRENTVLLTIAERILDHGPGEHALALAHDGSDNDTATGGDTPEDR